MEQKQTTATGSRNHALARAEMPPHGAALYGNEHHGPHAYTCTSTVAGAICLDAASSPARAFGFIKQEGGTATPPTLLVLSGGRVLGALSQAELAQLRKVLNDF